MGPTSGEQGRYGDELRAPARRPSSGGAGLKDLEAIAELEALLAERARPRPDGLL
jgi:hypothetical protein